MGVPTVEKAPGIKEPWLGMWRYALADIKDSGLWRPPLRPMLDEYITCLRLAREHRAIAEKAVQTIRHRAQDGEEAWVEELPPGIQRNRESGMDHPHPNFALALKHLAEARSLADLLGLSPKARQALTAKAEEDKSDRPAIFDELAQARKRKSA